LIVNEKPTTSAKALDFIRRPHPGHPGTPADPPLVCWGGLPGLPPKKGGPTSSLIFFGTHKMDRMGLHAKMKPVWNNETKPRANGC